jgi:hypothetical protein
MPDVLKKYFAVIVVDRGSIYPEFVQLWEETMNKKLIDGFDVKGKLNLYETIEFVHTFCDNKQIKISRIEILFTD